MGTGLNLLGDRLSWSVCSCAGHDEKRRYSTPLAMHAMIWRCGGAARSGFNTMHWIVVGKGIMSSWKGYSVVCSRHVKADGDETWNISWCCG